MNPIKELLYRIRGEYTTEKLISMGMKVGKNFGRLNGVILDPSHCWLIEIGDNVTLAPRTYSLPRRKHKDIPQLYQNRQSHRGRYGTKNIGLTEKRVG